jgi:adenine phosphoribosyltransferase
MPDLKQYIRDVRDFPKPGIVFKDITPLLRHPDMFRDAIDSLTERFRGETIDVVLGIESRGFIFAAPIAYRLGAGFAPVRKPGKLLSKTIGEVYELEYGSDRLEIHSDAIEPGQTVLIVDDLLATGGTARATANLVKGMGGRIRALAFLVELEFLKGRERLQGLDVHALISF